MLLIFVSMSRPRPIHILSMQSILLFHFYFYIFSSFVSNMSCSSWMLTLIKDVHNLIIATVQLRVLLRICLNLYHFHRAVAYEKVCIWVFWGNSFAGMTVIFVGGLFQLPPVWSPNVFSAYNCVFGSISHSCKLFKMCKLIKIMRQHVESRSLIFQMLFG